MGKFPILSAEQISASVDLAEIEYDVEEWKTTIKLKSFSLAERDEIVAKCQVNGKTDPQKLITEVVVHGVAEPKLSAELIAKKHWKVIDAIAQKVMALNGMLPEKGPSAETIADVTFRPEA